MFFMFCRTKGFRPKGIQNNCNCIVNDLQKFLSLIAKLAMVQFTTEQRVFIVLHYTKNQSTTAAKNAFQARFPDWNRKNILLIV